MVKCTDETVEKLDNINDSLRELDCSLMTVNNNLTNLVKAIQSMDNSLKNINRTVHHGMSELSLSKQEKGDLNDRF